jgi:hypothetical protein
MVEGSRRQDTSAGDGKRESCGQQRGKQKSDRYAEIEQQREGVVAGMSFLE